MKKITILTILLITINLFSQIPDNKSLIADMDNFFNRGKIEKLETITTNILSGKYGVMDDELKFYALMYSSNVYSRDEYANKDAQKGFDKLSELVSFAKNTSYAIPNKEAYIKSMSNYLSEYKNKHPEVKMSVKENENNPLGINKTTQTNTTETNSTPKSTSDDKTVTLTVSGTGKTVEEARLNALRSAIEQAFGAFISSKTEILNDNLVRDEIVSISNGNIQKYDIISQVEVPNIGYAMTLNATVSISNLTSFAESKGVAVEFKGGLFGIKIKLQKLNEEAEIASVKNLLEASLDVLNNSLEYELNVASEPRLNYNNEYTIDFVVKIKPNNNYSKFEEYFVKTIDNLSLKPTEISEYNSLEKMVYSVNINERTYTFRSIKSKALFANFFISSQILVNTFKLYSNEKIIKFNYNDLYKSLLNHRISASSLPKPILFNAFYLWDRQQCYLAPLCKLYINNLNLKREELLTLPFKLDDRLGNATHIYDGHENQLDIGAKLTFYTSFIYPEIQFSKSFQLSDLEKISEFKLQKIDINDFLKNRFLYMNPEPQEYGCFSADTKITTAQGVKSIQDIKVGDKVICFDDKGELHTSIVESINKHDNQDVYKYSIWNGEALYATSNHWVLTSENSFSEIGKLNEMLTLVDINGGLKPITKVEYIGKETVYNFIVKDYHTYLANDIRVHNGGKGKSHLKISEKENK